ncbi:MAG: PQQ-binding-like beta-propeller repeat protein [Bacteroidaceae bacterium]|nr:PQQ-binding-like beta-propeller repeat protein [Bacteroidaceae bacterium]
MNRKIYRNLAVVTAVFALALAVMLTVSRVQMRHTSPLQSQVMETLKELYESNPDNEELGQEIRQLDLLSRRAYFTQESQLKSGIWILCIMGAILAFCLRMYYKDTMNLPAKELDAIDEWISKSRSRRYLNWGVAALVAVTLLIGVFSSDRFKALFHSSGSDEQLVDEQADEVDEPANDYEEYYAQATAPEPEPESEPQPESQPATEPAPSQAPVTESAPETEQPKPEAGTAPEPANTNAQQPTADTQQATAKTAPWPSFRGPNASARSSVRGIPTAWNLSSGQNIAWKAQVPKQGYNSPVIHSGSIFLTGADEESRELYCFDLSTGNLRWTAKADGIAGSPSTMPNVNEDTGLAASTVATNGEQVCAIFATGDLLCTDMEGKRLWAKNLGVPDNHYGFASSLIISGNRLIVQYDNNDKAQLICIDTRNGNQLWAKTRKDRIAWSSPIITQAAGQQAVIVMGNPAITAYSLSNGTELWRVECMSGEVGASPCASDGIVFGASEYATVAAIDSKDGTVLWESDECMPECSSPVATKDMLYVATSYGAVCAYNASNGEVVKQHELDTPFYSSPVIADGKIWLFSNSGKCYIFSTGAGFDLITSFETGEQTFATPAFTDGMMVVRSDKSLYVVKKS